MRGEAIPPAGQHLDIAGAATVTAALMLAAYAMMNADEKGWTSGHTIGRLAVAAALLTVFLAIEARAPSPRGGDVRTSRSDLIQNRRVGVDCFVGAAFAP